MSGNKHSRHADRGASLHTDEEHLSLRNADHSAERYEDPKAYRNENHAHSPHKAPLPPRPAMIWRLRPQSLRGQLLGRSLLLIVVLFLLVGVLQFLFMRDFLYRNKAEALYAQLAALPPAWMHPGNNGEAEYPRLPKIVQDRTVPPGDEALEPGPTQLWLQPGLSLAFVDLQGAVHPLGEEESLRDDIPVLSAEQYALIREEIASGVRSAYQTAKTALGEEKLLVFRSAGRPGSTVTGLLQAGMETDSLRTQWMALTAVYASLAVAALGAYLALFLPLLRRTLKPLSRVVEAAEQTDAGNLGIRVPEKQGQTEIDSLSTAFNGMLTRLDEAFAAERHMTSHMRRFVADASHELRTPLTSIQGFIEVLQRGAAAQPDQLRQTLNSMHKESARLNSLVHDLLLLARLDQTPQLRQHAVRLDAVLLEMKPQLQLLAADRALSIDAAQPATVRGDHDKLKQVLLNLAQNAVQHTAPRNGSIEISLRLEGQRAVLRVADNGPGIAEEHLPHIFDRFYRGESSRSRIRGGAGLGLAITKSIVDAHGGSIAASNAPGGGAIFAVELPTENLLAE